MADTVARRGLRLPHEPTRPQRLPPDQDADPAGEETELIARAAAGDRSASSGIVDRYWDRLYRWLFRLTHDRHQAEDLAQETFLKALAALGSFRPGSNFRAWLFRIGHNNFVNLKRVAKRQAAPMPDEFPAADPGASPSTHASDREDLKRLYVAVAELPVDFRTALLLRAEEGLSFREIAGILRITEETARWRVFKARQKLVKAYDADSADDGTGDS